MDTLPAHRAIPSALVGPVHEQELVELTSFLSTRMAARFFGTIEIAFQNGHVIALKECQTHKLPCRETRKERPDEHGR